MTHDETIFDKRLIVALDKPDPQFCLDLIDVLGESVGFYKIGLGLLPLVGFDWIHNVKQKHQKRIFLDMKLFDIPTTIETAARSLSLLDVDFLTVQGDPAIVHAAKTGAAVADLKILACTILTSCNRDDLDAALIKPGHITDLVLERAQRALAAGADGLIASPLDVSALRVLSEASGKLIVTPGIRLNGMAERGLAINLGQKRVASPTQAILSGADYIVVGRPIWQAQNPKSVVQNIIAALP